MTKTLHLALLFLSLNVVIVSAQTTKPCERTCTVDKIVYKDAYLGVQLASPCHIDIKKGVAIFKVMEQTSAAENNLKAMDIIYSINNIEVNDRGELIKIIRSHDPFDEVSLTILRDHNIIEKKLKLGAKSKTIIQEKICCEDEATILTTNSIELFPNPAIDNLNITFKTVAKDEYSFNVYSTSGVLINQYKKNFNQKNMSYSIPVNKLEDGVYVLKISYQQKTISKLFVVNRK